MKTKILIVEMIGKLRSNAIYSIQIVSHVNRLNNTTLFVFVHYRLLDFSSLTAKRKLLETVPVAKMNGAAPAKSSHKRPKRDELQDILEQSNRTVDSDSGSEVSSLVIFICNTKTKTYSPKQHNPLLLQSNEEQITEAQYLKERNLVVKEGLLQDTSSESEMDEPNSDDEALDEVNGHDNDHDDDDDEVDSEDDSDQSESDDSAMAIFLNKKRARKDRVRMAGQQQELREQNANKGDVNAIESDVTMEAATKNASLNSGVAAKSDDAHSEADNSHKPTDDFAEPAPGQRRRAQIGKNVFSNLEKTIEIISPNDVDKSKSEDESPSKQRSKKSSTNTSDCEILDTSMFKETKSKAIDGAQLSKILSSANRPKASTSRALTDDAISLSSDSDLEMEPMPKTNTDDVPDGDEELSNRTMRQMLRPDQLAGETKRAQREESERVKRLEKKNDRLSQIIESQKLESQRDPSMAGANALAEVLLDYHEKEKKNIVVHKEIVKHLKQHQIEGIRFMYDCCYGSVDTIRKFPGSGCILAHCMGLGKTLQVIIGDIELKRASLVF